MRVVFVILALSVCGCGGCVDEGDGPAPATTSTEQAKPTRAVGSARPFSRFAPAPTAAIRDAGLGDE